MTILAQVNKQVPLGYNRKVSEGGEQVKTFNYVRLL